MNPRYSRRAFLSQATAAAGGALALTLVGCSRRAEPGNGQRATPVKDSTPMTGPTASTTATALYFPPHGSDQWEAVSPRDVGWDAAKLDELADWALALNTFGLVVLHRGRILLERYRDGGGLHATNDIASAQKCVTSVLAGQAVARGELELDIPAQTYLGDGWTSASAGQEAEITVRHLLTMSSGLSNNFEFEHPAGTNWYYNNNAYHMGKRCMEVATGADLGAVTASRLSEVLGWQDAVWSTRPLMKTPDGVSMTGFVSSCRDSARFGLMMLAGGRWQSVDLGIDPTYLAASLRQSQPTNPSYGYLWWLNGQDSHRLPGPDPREREGWLVPTAPAGMYAAMGADDNRIYIAPEDNLVVVRQGEYAFNAAATLSGFDGQLWERLMAARSA